MRRRLEAALDAAWYGRSTLKWVLSPLALVFGLLVAARRFAYARGWLAVEQLDAPVVVVGNVTVGGTGKTPVLIALAAALGARGRRVGIVTRGYGGRLQQGPRLVTADDDPLEVGDEPVLLARRTGRPVAAGAERTAAARLLLAETDVDVVLSDDGLQHYRLPRAFEIAVVDGARGLGNGMLLPAGPLREPPARLAAVDAVVVNGPGIEIPGAYRAEIAVRRVYALADGAATSLETFAGRAVHAVAGIGHPARFFAMLRAAGLDVREHALSDHARIDAATLDFGDAAPVLMTEKDAVKCARLGRPGLWCVAVDLRIIGRKTLVERVLHAIGPAPGAVAPR